MAGKLKQNPQPAIQAAEALLVSGLQNLDSSNFRVAFSILPDVLIAMLHTGALGKSDQRLQSLFLIPERRFHGIAQRNKADRVHTLALAEPAPSRKHERSDLIWHADNSCINGNQLAATDTRHSKKTV
jgi:hypothetical protein